MNNFKTNIPGFNIRLAVKSDARLIIRYIRELAAFEDQLDEVTATEESLEKYMFDLHGAETLIGEFNESPVGFAFFHQTFSTFNGKPGIALVDLYIEPEMRGRGFGKTMLTYLSKLTLERNCERLEWWLHDWNKEAERFYRKCGADMVKDIRIYRLCGKGLKDFSAQL